MNTFGRLCKALDVLRHELAKCHHRFGDTDAPHSHLHRPFGHIETALMVGISRWSIDNGFYDTDT